jgi:cytochrome c oxidase assembly factor CtaG
VLWTGGLLALLVSRREAPAMLSRAAGRFSALAVFCLAITAASGVLSALLRIRDPGDLASGYGVLLAGKTVALLALGAFGWWHRQRTLPALAEGRPGSFARIAWAEIGVLAATFGLAAGLARTPPPGSSRVADLIADSPLRTAVEWLPDPLFGTAAALAVGFYLAGLRRLQRLGQAWPHHRTAAWIAGWVLVLAATDLTLTRSGTAMLALNDRLQHFALAVLIPVLFVIGGGLRLARRVWRPATEPGMRGPQEWTALIAASPLATALRHPAVTVAVYATCMYVVYVSIDESFVLTSHAGHVGTAIASLAAGSLLVSGLADVRHTSAVRFGMVGSGVTLVALLAMTVAHSAPLPPWLSDAPPQPVPLGVFTSSWAAVTSMVILVVWVLVRAGNGPAADRVDAPVV